MTASAPAARLPLQEQFHLETDRTANGLQAEWSTVWADVAHAAAEDVLQGRGYATACRRIERLAEVYRRLLGDVVGWNNHICWFCVIFTTWIPSPDRA